jgi:pimeloyl-ACP methyl ester carboxylesterase
MVARAVVLMLALVAPLVSMTPVAAPVIAPVAPAVMPAPPLTACALPGVAQPALCGRLRRPLNPAEPDGRQIELHYAVLPALARQKKPDPVFFFAGGPGQSAIDLAGTVGHLLARFSNRRDIVLIDQRGTGASAALRCPGDDDPTRPLARQLDGAAAERALHDCRQALQRLPHGDLRQFGTTLAMQDADAVRQALGVERVNLVGVSYGTRAALEYLRQFPRAVRRVVLDGVVAPDEPLPPAMAADGGAAFRALLAWCRADADCHAAHPALAERWRRLQERLPADVSVTHPLTGRAETVRLTPQALTALVRASLYSPVLASAVPLAIEQAASGGRWDAFIGLAGALGGGRGGELAQGMHFSVLCAEDVPAPSPTPALAPASAPAPAEGDFDDGSVAQYARICADWPRADVPAAFHRVPASAAPVLLLSGGLDPVTPPRHAERVARALGPAARAVVVPQAGHGVLALACVRELAFRFVDADDFARFKADDGCARAVPRPPVFEAFTNTATEAP